MGSVAGALTALTCGPVSVLRALLEPVVGIVEASSKGRGRLGRGPGQEVRVPRMIESPECAGLSSKCSLDRSTIR